MKKSVLMIFVLFVLTFTGLCAAADDQSSDWTYEIQEDGSAMITAYTGASADLTIPDVLDGHDVTKLASDVFWFNENITSVEIPAGLTSFGDYVFLRDNEKFADFYRDNGKPYILVPEIARILADDFAVYADVKQVNPFLGCYNLEKISVSSENHSFAVIDNLLINKITNESISYPAGSAEKDYVVPEGITSIGFQTFFGSNVVSVSLPESLIDIAQNPFSFCVDLEKISVSDDNSHFTIQDGALVSKDGTLIAYPMAADAETYSIPEGIKAIGDGAFFNNKALHQVILPEGVASIGGRAFDHCEALESAVLPEGLLAIKNDAFKNCDRLKEINLPGTITSIDKMAFYNIGKQLVFTVEDNTYGALWVKSMQYRYHFPGEPENKSRLTQAYDKLKDEDGMIRKFHLNYRAENTANGYWFTRDVFYLNGNTYIIDEDEADGVVVTMFKNKVYYKLVPDSKTGTSVENETMYFEYDGIINEYRNFFTIIRSHVNRTDYTATSRTLLGKAYLAEVFPEYSSGPERAFYFDRAGNFVYCYEEKYYGVSPVGYGKGEILFTVNTFEKDFDESVFDISDYEITELPPREIIHISDNNQKMDLDRMSK